MPGEALYSAWNTYCADTFGALNDDLVQQTFGSVPVFVPAGDYVYPSRNSASIAFETNLPCKSYVEWGLTASYGNTSPLPDRWYFYHLHQIIGLAPSTTYHYRIVATDENDVVQVSADRTFTTISGAGAILIPGGSTGPYVCSTAGATYILTGNITCPTRGISIKASNVTLDLNGYTISYDNGPSLVPPGDWFDYLRSDTSTSGVHFFVWNPTGTVRILNGRIVQGTNNGKGILGIGFNPICIQEGTVEIAGIIAEYSGDDVSGFHNNDGTTHAHHNVITDRGTVITNRSQGIMGIFTRHVNSVTGQGLHHNTLRRVRHQGLMIHAADTGTAGTHDNEVYSDSYATNSYCVGSTTNVYNNKLFGTGYHCVAVDFLDHPAMYVRDNFIFLQAEAPTTHSLEYGPDSSVIGVRLTQYDGATFLYPDYLYERNVIIVKGRDAALSVRGVQLASSAYISNCRFRNNIVKCEIQDNLTRGACLVVQGGNSSSSPYTPGALPVIYENNQLITSDVFIRIGDQYSSGDNHQFRGNSFEKIGAISSFVPIRIGYLDWSARGHRIMDSILGGGVDFTAPAFEGTPGGVRNYLVGHALWVKALGTGGTPIVGGTVTVYDNTGAEMSGVTDGTGLVRLELVSDYYERAAGAGAGAGTKTTRSGHNLQTAGYTARTITPAEFALTTGPLSPLVVNFSAAADTTAPAAVVLSVGSPTPTTLTLSWTSPGDDGNTGTATAYEIRRSTNPITSANFATATLVPNPPTPAIAGTAQTMVVTGLQPGATWFFALRTSDEAGNWSPVSNSPSAQTTPQGADVTAPNRVTDLAVASISPPDTDYGDVRISWTAPGDDNNVGTAAAYDIRIAFNTPIVTQSVSVMPNGSLYPQHSAAVMANFLQDCGSTSPATYAALAIAEPGSIIHFVAPCDRTYAACLSAICDAQYQWTAIAGPSNRWNVPSDNAATVPDGAFGAPTAAAVVNDNLISRTFARATVYVNLSTSASVAYPGGTLPPAGRAIVQGTGYGTTNTPGMFPQRGGIFWGQTTAPNIASIAAWKTIVLNNSQTEGPTEGVNSLTPVADIRAARASAVPSNPTCTILESSNGLTVFVDGAGNPSVYFPMQQRMWAYCQAHSSWIYEDGSPLQGTSLGSITRYFDIRDQGFQEFFASEMAESVKRSGCDGVFGDEFHSIHPLRGSLHPTVPSDVQQTAGMARLLELMNSDFGSAGPINSTPPDPAVAGTPQYVDEFELSAGATIYVGLVSVDEAGNVSGLSNIATMQIPWLDDEAPTTVTDLAIVSTTYQTVNVQWSAPGDAYLPTGGYIPVTSYDLRYSTSPIDSGNFAAATAVTGLPTPMDPGTSQAKAITGLSASTLYYFAIRSTDSSGNVSNISNVPSVTTAEAPDTTAPAAVADLAVSIPTQTTLRVTWTAPGDDGNVGTATAYDLRISTSPITALNFATRTAVSGLPTPSPAGTAESVTVPSLTSSTLYYFALKTVDEAGNWSLISNLASGTTTAAPDTTAPGNITDLATGNITSSSVRLTWTAPGDDGATGTATSYEIRYSTAAINAGNFAAATLVANPPVPLVAGSSQGKVVTGLSASTLYYFAMVTYDEAGNVSGLSNVPTATTTGVADVTPPSAVTDLAIVSSTPTSLTLQWTAPGDDAGSGVAASYDIRYSTSNITAFTFASDTQVTGEPAPETAGTVQSMVVTGLTPGTTYYFAMITLDEVPNNSGLSNVVSGATASAVDTTPPAAITDLAGQQRTTTSIVLTWTAPGDDGGSGIASLYDVRMGLAPFDESTFLDQVSLPGAPAPAAAGVAQSLLVSGLEPGTAYYFAIKTADEVPNWSAISNVLIRLTLPPPPDTVAPNDVTDLAVMAATPYSITLAWTATGDDGNTGTAAQYDMRYSLSTITAYTFAAATQATLEPSPQVAGTVQGMTVTGLTANTRYYFALRVLDEVGNSSSLSNVVTAVTTGENQIELDYHVVNEVEVTARVI